MSFFTNLSQAETAQARVELLMFVYLCRFSGFIVTTLVAYLISISGLWSLEFTANGFVWLISCFLHLCFVMSITGSVYDDGVNPVRARAKLLYFSYCILNGFTFSCFFSLPEFKDFQFILSILSFLGLNVFMFALIFFYGFLIRREWSPWVSFCLASLGGWIWAGIFLKDFSMMIGTGIGVFILAGFMANEVRKIQSFSGNWHVGDKKEANNAVFVALMLHVDFINLFIDFSRLLDLSSYVTGYIYPYPRRRWHLLDD